ncbi:MAG TPA: adenylate/guanylate cyclase domain-containing protein [Nostocaceae cyanobacterium]|nr:adenylate/guanylate cyclase domain-containing protein [Nostocaceae cyanobacterium]
MISNFHKGKFSPSLFDITQDIIGTLPLKLISQWQESNQSSTDAKNLLAPYKVKGYSVSSDSVGLTRLTQQLGLLEILALINQPKEIIYGCGIALGGEGVGIWAADNTQMFFPESVKAEILLSALLSIQQEIQQNSRVQVGLGAHFGEFYYLNGGLYGIEADTIEEITENQTEGGEIVISQGFYERLSLNHNFTIAQRDHNQTAIGYIFRVLDGQTLSPMPPANPKYPIPYSEAFYSDLIKYKYELHNQDFAQYLTNKYLQNKVVVLVERDSQEIENQEVTLFTNLLMSAKLKEVSRELITKNQGEEIKVIGTLGIYTFDLGSSALNFAQALRQELARENIAVRIGIDFGQVLISDLPVGGKDIAGMPVNLASKMAQDKGEFGQIYLSTKMKELVDVSGFREINYSISGVEIQAYEG